MTANWIIQYTIQLWAACKNPNRDGWFRWPQCITSIHWIENGSHDIRLWDVIAGHSKTLGHENNWVCVCDKQRGSVYPWESDCCLAWPPVPSSKGLWNQKLNASASWSNSAWYVFLSCNCLFIGPCSKAILWRSLQAMGASLHTWGRSYHSS